MGRQPVSEQLSRLIGALEHAVDDGATSRTAGGHVLGRHHHRSRAHEKRRPQVGSEGGDESRVRGGHGVDQADEAAVAVGGALVEGVLADHVGRCEQEQLRLCVAKMGQAPSWASVRRAVVRTGAVRLVRSGRRRVPENLDMAVLLLLGCRWQMVRSGNRADERCRVGRGAFGHRAV